MSEFSTLLGKVLSDDAHLAQDRAAAELRAGRPLLIEAAGRLTLTAALDGASPSLFGVFSGLDNGVLALTPQRARMMGLAVDYEVALPLAGLDLQSAKHLASDPRLKAPTTWTEATAGALGAIDLCKTALLLPAVLAAPLPLDAQLPARLQRYRIDAPAGEPNAPYDLEIVSQADVPLASGIKGRFMVFRGGPAPRDQVAIVVGDPDPAKPVLVRAHSACLTGDLFGSLRCDCGDQLKNAMARLAEEGGGVLLYLDQEGRGIGIGNKMRAYALQDDGFDTIDADAVLGFSADERRYEYAASILHTLGYRKITLLTNNPEKIGALTRAGIEVAGRQALFGGVTAQNHSYLHTKAARAQPILHDLRDRGEATGTD
ncbi:MAG: cyclohydrolase [Caulobacteraceae bacterium]|nr:cyclohydrolase [Caulobacteraceae bacterium]